jgi:LCP family protein required for cell wall assembly
MTTATVRTKPTRRYTIWRFLGFCVFVFALAVGILAGGIFYVSRMTPKDVGTQGVAIDLIRSYTDTPGVVAFAKKPRLNILCLGVDYNYDNKGIRYTKGARSDTMFVLSVDKDAKELNHLSIARDCRVEFPNGGTDKINAAYSYGGTDLARKTAEKFLGVPMDHTVVIKEYAAQKIVDALGGVSVNVEKTMNYDDNWGHLHIHLKKGLQRLNGTQAVGYCRFRHDEEGDRGRMRRQQQFIEALMKEMRKPENLSRLPQLVKIFKQNIETDMTVGEVLDLAHVYKNFDRKKIRNGQIDGSDQNIGGIDYIIPDEREKNKLVSQLLLGGSAPGAAPNGATITVEVLNGSTREGAANTLADQLRASGYDVVNVGNAPMTDTPETYVEDHKNNADVVNGLLRLMGQSAKSYYAPKNQGRADITIVLGKDWGGNSRAASPAVQAFDTMSPSPLDASLDTPSPTPRRKKGHHDVEPAPVEAPEETPADKPDMPMDVDINGKNNEPIELRSGAPHPPEDTQGQQKEAPVEVEPQAPPSATPDNSQ